MSEVLLHERYEIVELIGEGGAAYVYLGEDLTNHSTVAIKQLKQPLHSMHKRDIVRQRFLREAKIQLSLQHPNIVRVSEVIEQEHDIYLVMEYVEGPSLKAFLQPYWEKKGAPVSLVVSLFQQLLEGLSFAHAHGVIHRDIKPSNLMVGADNLLKIADFGIARIQEDPQLTQTGLLLGTPLYMSPEQCRGDKEIGPSTDLYSAGVALFEALTGKTPFGVTNHSLSQYQLIQQHLFDQPPSLHTLRDDLPLGLDAVLTKALAKHPEERFPNAEAFSHALSLAGDPSKLSKLQVLLGELGGRSGSQTPAQGSPLSSGAPVRPVVSAPTNRRRPSTQAHSREAMPPRKLNRTFTPSVTGEQQDPGEYTLQESSDFHPESSNSGVRSIDDPPITTPPPFPSSHKSSSSRRIRPTPTISGKHAVELQPQKKPPWHWLLTVLVVFLLATVSLLIRFSTSSREKRKTAARGKPGHFFTLSKKMVRSTPPRKSASKGTRGKVRKLTSPSKKRAKSFRGMVKLSGGWFVQGQGKAHHKSLSYLISKNNRLRWMKNDHPQRKVYLSPFWMDKREVRVGEYEVCVQAKHCRPVLVSGRFLGRAYGRKRRSVSSTLESDLPMVFVRRKEARRYCQWLQKRLPTEAEWERAARGKDRRLYPWGSSLPPNCTNSATSSCPSTKYGKRASAALRGRTPQGIFDLAGNVWEWTEDCYASKGYLQTETRNPLMTKRRCYRGVVRGGSFLLPTSSTGLRSYYRRALRVRKRRRDVGFRCARSAKP